jgi:adenine-specific DNA-methyltransferase
MSRRWLGVEWSQDSIDKYAVPRLIKICDGLDETGVTKHVEWAGGGGFRVLEVAPSMFDATNGQVFLSDWATNGQLSEATAAQLHYDYKPDPPFCGLRGRSRLAVVDGLVNSAVVRLLVDALADGERLVVCGTAIDPEVRTILKDLLPGSSVRKIPQSILREYRQALRNARVSAAHATPTQVPGAEEFLSGVLA